jgi:hypothetical protein
MKRQHLFEFHERGECPRFIRDSVVETLGTGLRWLGMGDVAGPAFARFCRRARCTRALDLCSGSGAPAALLVEWLEAHGEPVPRLLLSDLFPNEAALAAACARHPTHLAAAGAPVDATKVPAQLEHDARLVINAFHHFAPAEAARIVADAVAARKSLFIYEGFPRDLRRFLPTGPAMLPALFLNPLFTRRQRAAKALFTYLLPVIPAIATWDGVVSVLRIHDEAGLRAMTRPEDDYDWSYEEVAYGRGGRAVVFSGVPRERLARA